ncbi:MAG: hypothetical protein K0R61_2680, partial [Microvirga sp.]|nr:hypothetical protein [Microvirga sp.]
MFLPLSRRQSLKGLALLGAGASVTGFANPSGAQAPPPADIKDEDIFQFAL